MLRKRLKRKAASALKMKKSHMVVVVGKEKGSKWVYARMRRPGQKKSVLLFVCEQ
jgi:hypothetical protein